MGREGGDFEKWVEAVGAFGPWQLTVLIPCFCSQIIQAMMTMSMVFLQIKPEFKCDTATQRSDECLSDNNQTCQSFSYDKNVMQSTIVTQWDLVCEEEWRTADAQMVFMLGFLLGSVPAGLIADRVGRKPLVVLGGVATAGLGVAESLAPTFATFLIIRFFLSLVNTACFQATYVLSLEVTAKRYKDQVAALFFTSFALGIMGVSGLAYLLRDWRTLHLAVTVPLFINALYALILSESPRWLLSAGRSAEAEKILLRAAQLNGRLRWGASSEECLLWTSERLLSTAESEGTANEVEEEECKEGNLALLKTHRRLAARFAALAFIWVSVGLVYYGVSLARVGTGTGVFASTALMGAIEFPAYAASFPLLAWGRRRALFATLGTAACLFLAVPFLPQEATGIRLCLFVLGKGVVTATFNIIFAVTAELCPTNIRNTGVAAGSTAARIGSTLAPYAAQLGGSGQERQMLFLFAGVSGLAGLLSLTFPETAGKALPDTLLPASLPPPDSPCRRLRNRDNEGV